MIATTGRYVRIEPREGEPIRSWRARVWRASDLGYEVSELLGERVFQDWRWLCSFPHPWIPPGFRVSEWGHVPGPPALLGPWDSPLAGTVGGGGLGSWDAAAAGLAGHWQREHQGAVVDGA